MVSESGDDVFNSDPNLFNSNPDVIGHKVEIPRYVMPVDPKERVGGNQIAFASEIGPGHKVNEDELVVINNKEYVCLAVIDGMGGHFQGDTAAKCLRDQIKEGVSHNSSFEDIQKVASRQIRSKVGERTAGAAYVAAIIKNSILNTYQAGDSRCIVVTRHGVLVAQTNDEGELNVLNNAVTSQNPGQTTKCISQRQLYPGDVVILFTDGVSDNSIKTESYRVFAEKIRRADPSHKKVLLKDRQNRENGEVTSLVQGEDATLIVQKLMTSARNNMENGGKSDDATVVVYVHK